MSTTVLFIIRKNWNSMKCPSTWGAVNLIMICLYCRSWASVRKNEAEVWILARKHLQIMMKMTICGIINVNDYMYFSTNILMYSSFNLHIPVPIYLLYYICIFYLHRKKSVLVNKLMMVILGAMSDILEDGKRTYNLLYKFYFF